jgi:hypothetical protein
MRVYLLNISSGARLGLAQNVNAHYFLSLTVMAICSRLLCLGNSALAKNCQQMSEKGSTQGAEESTKTYIDTQAAMEILKSTQKPILTDSPFVKYLYIGANNEGYWNSYHMSLQLEDVVDFLQVLYPEFKIVFLFDHSQGHACKRNGALNTLHMSRTFGGAQAFMRDTTITQAEDFLALYSRRYAIIHFHCQR